MRSTGQRLKWDISAPKPDGDATKPALHPSVHDRWMRLLGLLLVGLVIPRFALLFDKFTWRDADYWIGTGWFLLAAVALWESNRALALRPRPHPAWPGQAVRRAA